jgi:hypothetical protein
MGRIFTGAAFAFSGHSSTVDSSVSNTTLICRLQ